jgi:hypothetical protein
MKKEINENIHVNLISSCNENFYTIIFVNNKNYSFDLFLSDGHFCNDQAKKLISFLENSINN